MESNTILEHLVSLLREKTSQSLQVDSLLWSVHTLFASLSGKRRGLYSC